ncbi:hypothetical protein I305_05838 [Cryptococcus gattii E566]|uniref:Uncharacterized protein n=1 Tax=Cryptococcus gattii EJB2 TaxID=1296103 RepID=A0ABR5C185_9TREE|nr:hypothetical protein I306_01258 [Cryptococcus gattii EJB2]KIY31873.1 hypothetical protein I305_05838 [Cryptococcus gattii E566]KJD99501.1 hypothetical protein I311_06913 [Cryptococcus gattii NT-10]
MSNSHFDFRCWQARHAVYGFVNFRGRELGMEPFHGELGRGVGPDDCTSVDAMQLERKLMSDRERKQKRKYS